jgi:hypothetical protein
MNNKKQYPKLFKTLSRVFGARKAVKLLRSLVSSGIELIDHKNLACAFYFMEAPQGNRFWAKRVYHSATYSKFIN